MYISSISERSERIPWEDDSSESREEVVVEPGNCTGITRENPWLSNKPKTIQIGQELGELWSKQCFAHNSLKSQPIWMILGSFESHGFSRVIPMQLPVDA